MANNSIIAPNEFLPDENDKMFSSQRVQEQVFRLNQLAKLGGGEDWEGYQKKEEETGIPAIYHAFSKERRNVNEVHVPPGAVNEDNAELLESMPPADAAQIGFDKVTLDALAEYGRRRKFYGQMLDAQVEQMSAGEQWQSFGSGKFATAGMDAPEDITPENYGDNLSKMARAIREADGVDEVEARLRAERLMQVAGHKRTPEEQTYLDGAYARIQNGESIDTILAEDAFNKSPYLSRMLQLYDNTLRRTAMMTQAVIGEVYGGEQWEKFSDKEKGYALDALRQSFPGLPWLHDVSPAMIGEKTLAGGGLQWENLANIMGAVTIGKAIIESFNPFSDGNPLYMGGGALKTNRYYYNRMIDAARPSSLAFDIGQGAIDSLAFLVNIGFGGFAAGTEKLLETITWRTALPTLGKVFGINALHALKGGKYGAYAINALVQGIGENMTAAEANPVVVYDGSTGMKVELNDGDADSMFNNIVLAFGRNYLAQAISVGTEGVGGVIDGLVTLPKGAKKFLLQKILGNLSPKVMARTQDMLGRFGINGMTGEFFEELLEDYLQPAKDRMLELVGADALSTHQTPQSWASPGRWALTTAGVLYAMRAPFSAVSTATVISDYARGKIAFEQVLNEAGVGEGSKPTDKDQSAVSGHAQRAMHVVNGRVHFVPSVGVEAVYAKHPDVAEKIRPIIHDDGTGTMAVNSFEAGEMMRNNPETVNAMREVLECTTSVKNLSVEDARAALQVYGDRVQFVSDVAGAVKLGIEAMPDSSRRRRISGGNSYAIAQMVACFADVLLGRDFELLPPDAKAARKEEVIKAISGLTASDADALSSAVPVEERKGFNIGEAYDNLVALRNATADFADATGMDVSPSVMNAAEAAVALQDATEDTADLDVKLNDAVAAMLMAGLNGRPMMRVGNMALRVREVKGEADNSPATFRAEIQFLKPDTAKADRRRTPDANGVLVLGEADTYDKAVAIISTDAELRDDIRTRLAEATEATKAWRNAVNAGLYTALHGDAAMLANGDNITIRNEGGEINLRATAPLYRNLLKAVIMQQAGRTAEEVYTETMWIGDGNGNWTMALPRFELSDEAVNKFANGTPVTLGDIVGKNYPLFRIHPEMAALTVPVLDGDAADTVSGVPPRDAAAVREHAAGALRGDAKSRGMLAAMVYASVADVLERREGLQDGAIPRMMPNDDAITGEHLRDIVLRDGANGIFNQQEIDRRLIRSFAIPQEHQGNPAEYVLRLANGAGGIDALLEKGIETNATPPELQGLTTFSEKGGLVNDYSTLITLLKGADASTMPHELGHWMLRVLRQFVKSGVASRQLMDAVAAIDAHLDNYARSKGAIEGTNEWESVRHEAFSESFVKYLMTADADELTQGAFSQLRRQLLNTYKWMRSNSTIEPAASLNELFDSLVAAGEMFDRGEAPLSAFDADTFRAIFAEAGLLDSSNEAIGKFLDLLGIARDAQETLAGREAVNSIDREKLTAEARQKYADSSFAKLAAALNRLGGFPVEALIEALPDTVPGEKREELRRVLHETARRQGWAFHARTAEALMREARRGEEDAKAAVKAQTTRIAEMEQQLAALENHAREVADRPAAIRQEIDSIMADVNAIAKKIEDLQSRHFPDAQRLTELQSQLDINKKRHKPTAKLREEIDTLQKRMVRFVRKREELNYAQRRLNDKAMKASGRLERVNASNAVAEAQADVAQKKADIEIARGRLAELQGALQIARENANAARAHTGMRDVTYSITAYHGSRADFDKFASSFINTGEGVQAYGHGIYFTSEEDVARWYAEKLASPGEKRNLYKVKLFGKWWRKEKLLDWDEAMPPGQMKRLSKALRKAGNYSAALVRLVERLEKMRTIEKELSELGDFAGADALENLRDELRDVYNEVSASDIDPVELTNQINALTQKYGAPSVRTVKDLENLIKTIEPMYRSSPKTLKDASASREARTAAKAEMGYAVRELSSALRDIDRASRHAGDIRLNNRDTERKIDVINALIYGDPTTLSGKEIYKALSEIMESDKAASEFLLKEAGINGITYIGRSSGKRDYVIFDDADIAIEDHIRYKLGGTRGGNSPADLAQMRKRAEAFAARYPGVVFHIVDHFDQLSETLRERPQSRYMEGCVDENGEVWIVLGMVTPERLDAVCAHETVGHVGLENFIGAGFLGFLDDVYRQHVSDMAEIRRRYGIDDAHGGVAEQRRLTREWLAHLAESLPEDRPGFWAQIVAAFRELLRSLGFDVEWSERDLRVLLAKDAVYLRNATAADITAQYGESARPYPDGGALHSISPNSDFSSQAAEDLRSLEISDQMRALRAAMDSGELPARSFAELVDAIASFRTEADFVKEYKAAAMRDAFNHPDMTMRMKTLDSAKLNAMFEQLALVLKQFAPNYTYSQRRQINVSRALQLIGGSTVNAIMHNRLDAEGLDGDVRLFGSIKAEANNIVMALSKIAKRAGELRKDGEPTTESLKAKARDAQLALESLNRINQFVAVARRINRAQAMVTNFVKELRVSSLGKQRGRIDGDALNAMREILLAVTHNQNVPIDANSQRNSVGNWRKRYVSEMDAAAVESGMEPRQWGEVCFRDDIDLQSLTIDEAQELSEFFKFIKHTGRALVDQTRLDNKEHRRSTIRQIVAELTPDAERNNHHAMPATEERDAGLWELLKSVCRSWDARSTSVWRYMTEHGEALNGIYRLLTEMKTREDSLRALVYDGNGADGLNTILQDIERIASEQGVDVSSLDNSPVAFTGNDDTHSYRHWTLHEVIMATLYLGTDSGRQRLRRTINTDSAMREADLVEKYPDAVLEQIPAALPPVILEKVNGIWAALERLNASVRDTYRKQYGYELDLLDPVPFSVNGVQMTGGYAPIAYRYSAAAYKPGLQDKVGEGKGTDMDLFERGRAYTPQTQAVHKRLGILFGHPPLALTMKTLLRYTEEASHYASHALGMGYILKVMRSKEVKNVFERAYGVEAYRALEATLLQVSAPNKYLERATTAEKYLKSTVVAAALWGNASSVLKQTASITVGASEVGIGNLLSTMGDFLAHPREMVAKVREASPYMRNRVNKLDDNIANTLEQLFATGSERILNRVQWLGYAPIGYFDMVVAGIGFTAAFRKAISDGRTPMEAKAYAEDFVKRTQGSAETLYNPQIKNTFFGRSMTMFMTAAIAQYNFLRHDMAIASKRGIASTVSAVAFDMVVPALICAAITMVLTPGGGGDDDDTELEKRIARGRDEFLANLWGGIPMANFVGDAWLTMAASDFSGGRMNRMEYLSPLADAVGSLGRAGKLAYNGQLLAAAINLGNAISIPANMPVIKVAERLAKYAKALHLTDPDEKPWTLREFTREAEKETR